MTNTQGDHLMHDPDYIQNALRAARGEQPAFVSYDAPKDQPWGKTSEMAESYDNPSEAANPSGSLIIPAIRPFLISEANQRLLQAVDELAKRGRNVNVLVNGKHGTGKSELAAQFAATRGRPFAQLDCGGLTEAFQLFGRMSLRGGETFYQRGLFLDAIETPNAVVHLQELNRAESDRALNALFSILDDTTRGIWIEELGEYAKVAEGVTFFATLNEGYQYIGTMPLDEALRNRFLIKMALNPLPRDAEESLLTSRFGLNRERITPLLDLVERIRHQSKDTYISTRDLVAMGELLTTGLDNTMVLRAVVGSDNETMESILLSEHMSGFETEVVADKVELLR